MSKNVRLINAARLPGTNKDELWDIKISHGRISHLHRHDPNVTRSTQADKVLHAGGRLVAPSLCHAHVHLDKCFLLQDAKYDDLSIEKGDFAEAMTLTGEAKKRFEEDDLLRRGRKLIHESIECGVTAMRAFVEVDEVVKNKCIDAAIKLKHEFSTMCEIQICAFAQLALFSGEDGGVERRKLLEQALANPEVEVVGTTPYVEEDAAKEHENIRWTIAKALSAGKHLDFHLDYNIDPSKKPSVWVAVQELKAQNWHEVAQRHRTICFGHCTRLTAPMFGEDEWQRLAQSIKHLPCSFVGLPISDLFIMGRTLHIPSVVQKHDLNGAISINNVGNAFTPQGNVDPLLLASMSVSIYQAGARRDTEMLYECISTRAKGAIGLGATGALRVRVGDPADLVIFDEPIHDPESPSITIFQAVLTPPSDRQVLFKGVLL
ncbi:MAG: hypothetical protein M1828_003988 [Chrysothrix sp. TS-e1954]|nr:MAG: hypothetical protein M1828_003988 [Chrysothrix sp. TS-e1954]